MSDKYFFYCPASNIKNNNFFLSSDESQHFKVVFKRKELENVWLFDGEGTAYEAEIVHHADRQVSGNIRACHKKYGENKYSLHLTLALLKNDQFETAIEKAVELGVTRISPVLLDRCIKRKMNSKRLQKIILSAVKQSGRSVIPVLDELLTLKGWQENFIDLYSSTIVCHTQSKHSISDWFARLTLRSEHIGIFIGPEGDFTSDEMESLFACKIKSANLGIRRLKSGTACLAALSICNELMNTK